MASVAASGELDIQDIVDVFGGSPDHDLTEYYRGGAYVPDVAANDGIPTSGEIDILDFYGAVDQLTVTVTQGTDTTQKVMGYVATNKTINQNFNGFLTEAARGSRTPTSFLGATIQGLYEFSPVCPGGTFYFAVVLSGTRSKSWFSQAIVQGGGTLNTSASTHFQNSSSTVWYWSISDYGTWDGSGNRTVTLVP